MSSTRTAHITIRGFINKDIIDFDEVGGIRICLEEDMIKYLSRDKIREMLTKAGHDSFDRILNEILDSVLEKIDE